MSSTTSGSSLGIADIIGIAIGGVLGLVTVIGIIISVYAMCGKKNKQSQVWAQPAPQTSPYGGYGQPTYTGYYQQNPHQPPGNMPWNNNEQPPAYSSVDPASNSHGNYKH